MPVPAHMDIEEAARAWNISTKSVSRKLRDAKRRGVADDGSVSDTFQHNVTQEFVTFRAWKAMSKSGEKWSIVEETRLRYPPEGFTYRHTAPKELAARNPDAVAPGSLEDLNKSLLFLADEMRKLRRRQDASRKVMKRNQQLQGRAWSQTQRLRDLEAEVERLREAGQAGTSRDNGVGDVPKATGEPAAGPVAGSPKTYIGALFGNLFRKRTRHKDTLQRTEEGQ